MRQGVVVPTAEAEVGGPLGLVQKIGHVERGERCKKVDRKGAGRTDVGVQEGTSTGRSEHR